MEEEFGIELVVPQVLSEEERERLVRKLIIPARAGFGTLMEEDDIRNHVVEGDFVYTIATRPDELVGFASFNLLSLARKTVLYLNGVVITQNHQRKGLMKQMVQLAVQRTPECRFLVARTQNDSVRRGLLPHCENLHPDGQEPPLNIQQIALAMAERLGMRGLDPKTLIEVGTYGRRLNTTETSYRGKDDFLVSLGLNLERGDSVMLVGQIKSPLT